MNKLALKIKNLPVEMIAEILSNLEQPCFYVTLYGEVSWFDTIEEAIIEYIQGVQFLFLNGMAEEGDYLELGKIKKKLLCITINNQNSFSDEIWINMLILWHKKLNFDFRKVIYLLKNKEVAIWDEHGTEISKTFVLN